MCPHCLCIGTQKAGTSWLWSMRSHPDIWLPVVKEIHYFYDYMEKPQGGITSRSRHRPWRHQLIGRMRAQYQRFSFQNVLLDFWGFFHERNDEWYASLFRNAGKKITGDITPAYSALNKGNVADIYRLMPEAKVLFILRNPIDRAWSNAVLDRAKRPGR